MAWSWFNQYQLIFAKFFKLGMFLKQSIHVEKKIAKGMISIIFSNIKNKIPVFF